MEIIFNKNCVETKEIDGEPCILMTELIKLSGVHFTQIYQKLRQKYSLHKYIRGGCRKRHITLEGCIKLLELFREPNDALINEIKNTLERESTFEKKIPAEQLIDIEMKRLDNEKLDFENLNQRVSNLEVKTNDIVAGLSISESRFKERIEDLENKLEDVENNLSYINDKPNQSSFKDLLKECIKEIIKEELRK